MKTHNTFLRSLAAVVAIGLGAFGIPAQTSYAPPGTGGSFTPNMGGGFNPGPPPPAYWGSPWYSGWDYTPSIVVSPSISVGNFADQGTTKVVGCGYDAQGVWRVVPMLVSYQYNGAQYVVNVLNAWNPWTDSWDRGVDDQAYNTNYLLRGVNYDYYVVLPYGTFYFNL